MTSFLRSCLLVSLLSLPLKSVVAQEAALPATPPAQVQQIEQSQPSASMPAPASEQLAPQAPLEDLMKSLGGKDGLGLLALVALLIQGAMFTLQSSFGAMAGKYRLAILYALSMVGGVITLKLQGLDTFSALTHSNSMAAYQVFLHQAYKQFFVKSA